MVKKMMPVAGALAIVLLGLLRARWAGALSGSILGTCLIGTGLGAMLLYKGARPFSHVLEARSLYGAVIAAMVVFGMLAGLVLGPIGPRRKPQSKEGE